MSSADTWQPGDPLYPEVSRPKVSERHQPPEYWVKRAAELGVPLDTRPFTPRYQVVKHGFMLHFVYVFTGSFTWDHLAGPRWTRRGAQRLGRKAVRAALLRTPEQAVQVRKKGRI